MVDSPNYWQQACSQLSNADAVMEKLIATYHGEALTCRGDAFYTLARSITGQQVSVKAAQSMWDKFSTLLGNVAPQNVHKFSDDQLRACGLSRQKITYLRGIADYFLSQQMDENYWQTKNDEDVMRELIAIKGIGRWTVEMFLIFHLMRSDVLPLADIGMQKAVFMLYNNGEKMEPDALIAISERWKPWRSVATWYLWRALDPVPVTY